ncbi:polysaccharide pyruvyl transferase family protein [Halomonas nitroreducens]|uniref:Polysaccharide pyruvyl transferase family protein n=1 Tax=Halomonas nitroreducens TaxID=447425 RepID=A0A3S0JXL4_9GAMM|nr:polysaccharide pyruvyl transferase family protein [Halomonas nitroreducens]RTR05340.1 polysaccharide pyruvyl transferase family protein [Halomonas nitroreducens]
MNDNTSSPNRQEHEPSHRIRVCLVNDTSNTHNWGARATSQALRTLIHEAGGTVEHTLYESRLTAPQYADRRSLDGVAGRLPGGAAPRRIGRGVLNRLARYYPDAVPACWAEFDAKARAVMDGRALRDIRQALTNSDLVMISGEGCIYGNLRQSRMLFFIAYLARCWLDKETALVNHSADLAHPVLSAIAREVYPRLDEVVFREADSARACGDWCRPRIAADAAYRLTPAPPEAWLPIAARPGYFDGWPSRAARFDPARPYVCVGGSSSYLRRGHRSIDPVAGYVALCRRLAADIAPVLLVAASWQDERIFRAVAAELDMPLVGIATPVQQAIDIIGNALAYVGGRWHSGVFAHAGGTPTVALGAYTPKMQALLHHAGLPGEPFDPFALASQSAAIIRQTRDLIDQGEALRERLRATARRSACYAEQNVGILAARHAQRVSHSMVIS